MSSHELPLIAGVVFVGALACTGAVRAFARRRHLLDRPNARSSHSVPVPRLGGIGIVVPFLLGAAAIVLASGAARAFAPILAGTAVISAVGLLDDLRSVPARVRFLVQVVAAMGVVALSDKAASSPWPIVPWPIWAVFFVLWIVWLTNLYNFMDGIDGLAGGQGVIAAVAIAVVAQSSGASVTGSLLVILAAAIGGFLVLNFPPASIFMGDVGSTAIGFFLACLPLLPGTHSVRLEVVGIALALFILDATVTLLRRVARGERWFEAHRSHYYQRPVALGIPHRTITLVACAGMAIAGASAVAFEGAGPTERMLIPVAPVLVFVCFAAAVHHLERTAGRWTGSTGTR